jgi:hypothetical protein
LSEKKYDLFFGWLCWFGHISQHSHEQGEHTDGASNRRDRDLRNARGLRSGGGRGGGDAGLRDRRGRRLLGASVRARGEQRVLRGRRLKRLRRGQHSGDDQRLGRDRGERAGWRRGDAGLVEREAALDGVGPETNVALARVADDARAVRAAVLRADRHRDGGERGARRGDGRRRLGGELLDGEPRVDNVHAARVVLDRGEPVDARQVVAGRQAVELDPRLLVAVRVDLHLKGRGVLDARDVEREVPAVLAGQLEVGQLRLVKLVGKVEHDVRVVLPLDRVARELTLEEALVVDVEQQRAAALDLALVELERNRRVARQHRLRRGVDVRRAVDRAHVEEVGAVELEQLASAGPVPARLHVNAKRASGRRVSVRTKVEPATVANPEVAERVLGVAETLGEVDASDAVRRGRRARLRRRVLDKRIDLELKEWTLKVGVHQFVGVVDPLVDVRVLLVDHDVRARKHRTASVVPRRGDARAAHEEVRLGKIAQRRLLILNVVLDGQKKADFAELQNDTIRSRRVRSGLVC